MKILITGATSHVGVFAIIHYIRNGYTVHATVRDASRREVALQMITKTGNLTEEEVSKIKLFEADLTKEEGWEEAIEGCEYVCHVAYPFLNGAPFEVLEKAAIDGTMNLLKLSAKVGIKQFVYCSSIAAVGYNSSYPEGTVIDESFWTDLNDPVLDGYMKSKIIVEKKMLEFINSPENTNGMAMTSFCPNAILGPLPVGYTNYVGLPKILYDYMQGGSEESVGIYYGVSDVRDLVKALVKSTGNKDAFNERFVIVTEKQLDMEETFKIIKEAFPEYADKLPKRVGQVWLTPRQNSSAKVRKVLGYDPIDPAVSLLDLIRCIVANLK